MYALLTLLPFFLLNAKVNEKKCKKPESLKSKDDLEI